MIDAPPQDIPSRAGIAAEPRSRGPTRRDVLLGAGGLTVALLAPIPALAARPGPYVFADEAGVLLVDEDGTPLTDSDFA